ncbi:MAG TPA: S8/S53 family peptidase [Candidatus Limadaptatus stercoripullorum]|uniref:S8/S53 family peptidase n=1 Tax=Candidatus Limadaptatus stercoripullorum TaxID=2840846 RepID=A0A9D1SWC6_9FIRM|nr:S8/S53 family peptidase [Candidatus Limadaptatus stercoripullorum]
MKYARGRCSAFAAGAISAIIAVACVFSCLSAPVADALLPESWETAAETSDGDWYLEELGLDAVAEYVRSWLGSDSYDFSALADDPVVVAVIDSGVNTSHDIFGGDGACPDVLFRDATGEIVGVNTVDGGSFGDGAPDRHGTHVAGIIAALIHALDLEDYIKIMPIKAGKSDGKGTSFDIPDVKEAVEFALDRGADVVNLSLTADSVSWNIITDEWAERAVFVAAAGNDGKSAANMHFYPAESDNAIGVMNYTVSASGERVLTGTSNYGGDLDIAAPGDGLLSADGTGYDGYKRLGGTSMASPVVAFAAALLEVKWRASEAEEYPEGVNESECVKEVLLMHGSRTAKSARESNKTYRALDMPALAGGIYRYSVTSGGMTEVSPGDVTVAVETQPGTLSLGSSGLLELSAAVTGLNEGMLVDIKWALVFGSGEDAAVYKAEGERALLSYVAPREMCSAAVVCEVYLKGTSSLIAVAEKEITLGYAVPGEDTVGISGADGTGEGTVVLGTGGVLSLKDASMFSPSAEIVWYADGKEIGRGDSVTLDFEESGVYEITVAVSDAGAEYSLTVRCKYVAEDGGTVPRDTWVIVGVVCGAAVVIVIAVIAGLLGRARRR